MKTILEILVAGGYVHNVWENDLIESVTRGLWMGSAVIDLPKDETIHGNKLSIDVMWLQIGATGKRVTEEFIFRAHGISTTVTADRMIEELRKHI